MTQPPPRTLRRRWPVVSAVTAVAVGALLGVLAWQRDKPFGFDAEWMEEILDERSAWLEAPALLMDWLGGGLVGTYMIPVGIVVVLCLLRRFWAALFYALAALISVGITQLLKAIFDRVRPEDMLVVSDAGSFPSGHVANAATMAVVLSLIIRRAWVWVAGVLYVVLMALSRTYLGAHWLSDTIGGALLGAGVAIIVWAPLAFRLHHERNRPR